MRSITLLATTPVGENGERLPASAPLPIMTAIRKNEMPVRAATAMAGGASSAVSSDAARSDGRQTEREEEEHDGQHARMAAAQAHRPFRDALECPVARAPC